MTDTITITTAQALPLTVSLASGAAVTGVPVWASDTPSVATVTAAANGLTADVYPVAPGTANISVALANETSGTLAVTVTQAADGQLVITPGTPVPYTPAPPPAANVYPLTMQPVATPAAPVTLGGGPDILTLVLGSSLNPNPPSNVIAVMVNGTVVAAPVTVTAFDLAASVAAQSQVFTLNGDWGALDLASGNPQVQIVGVGSPGMSNLEVKAMTYNYVPLGLQASIGSGNSAVGAGATSVWDNAGATLVFGPLAPAPVTPVTPPPPAATPSIITGATVNGTVVAPATLQAIIEAAPANATVALPAGTFIGTTDVPQPMTITGAGMGQTIISCANLAPYQDKAVIVPTVPGVTISNLTVEGAAISAALGDDAAGVRDGANGVGFTLINVESTGNQDGILTFSSNINLTGCNLHGNGAGTGLTHECYVNGDTTNVATIASTNFTCGPLSTHALKTRAGTTNVTGGVLTGSADPTGAIGGSVIDIPDCGIANFSGTTMILAAGTANTLFLGYGMESGLNLTIGKTVTLTNVTAQDNNGKGGSFQAGPDAVGATLVIGAGCTYVGAIAPTFSGWASVTGAFTPAVA